MYLCEGQMGLNTSLLFIIPRVLWASWGMYLFYFLPQCPSQGLESSGTVKTAKQTNRSKLLDYKTSR